ncbi:hypothetical protein QOZ80_3BG0255060 [Eleusine coracana subsp. coracana]|nr:hypothetical protein QOZ80_3BG0255060 [Eleusine coracana subsp. coracana]
MGSLMSGWNSTVLDDARKVRRMRNRSLTKEEVDAFWRQHGRPDTSGHQASPRRSDESQQEEILPLEARRLDAIRSLPSSPLARGAWSPSSSHGGGHQQQFSSARSEPPSSPAAARAEEGLPETGADSRPSTSCDWWTRSNWAFLNEPPHTNKHEEASVSGKGSRAHKGYALDQFHAARIVTGNA